MIYAIKEVLFTIGFNEDIKKHRYFREAINLVKISKKNPHPNIVKYYLCWLEGGYILN